MDYADRTYKIEITAKGFGEKKNTAEEVGGAGGIQNQTGETAGGSTGGNKKADKPDKDLSNAVRKLFGYAALKSYASKVIGYEVSTVQLSTGSHEAQQRANFTYSLAQQGFGIVEGAVAGASVGGGYGAIAGVVLSLVNTGITWAQKANTLAIQQGLEDTQQAFASQRVTVSGSRYQNAGD